MGAIRFKVARQVPPSGRWFYRVPETGLWIESVESMEALLALVSKHYADNSLPLPENLRARVIEYICCNSPEGFCDGMPGKKRLSYFEIENFTRVLFNRLKSTKEAFFVPQEEADRRAQICATCPMNHLGICTTCNGLKQVAARLVQHRGVKKDERLGVCAVCGCVLHAKVHIRLNQLPAAEKSHPDLPEHCWVRGA